MARTRRENPNSSTNFRANRGKNYRYGTLSSLPKFLPLNCKKVVEEFLSSSARSRPAGTGPQLRTDLPERIKGSG
jgi:hypothetical protein